MAFALPSDGIRPALRIAANSSSTARRAICALLPALHFRVPLPSTLAGHDVRSTRSTQVGVDQMRVACRCRRRGVAEHLADLHQAGAATGERTGAAMPEVVDADVRPADDRPDAIPSASAGVVVRQADAQQLLGDGERLGLQRYDVQFFLLGVSRLV